MSQNSTARSEAGTRRSALAKTAAYYAAFVALGLAGSSFGPTLPGLAAHTNTPLSKISLLFTVGSLGYFLGSYRVGRLYDRLPGHMLMAGMLILLTIALGLMPVMPALWLLLIVRLASGFSQGSVDVGGNVLLIWVHGHKVGPFMNGLHFFWGIGAFLSPIIVAQAMAATGDITWAYWLVAVLMLPAALWLLRQPSPMAPAASEEHSQGRTSYLLALLVALFLFLYVGAEVGFGDWIYTYAVTLGLNDKVTAAYLTSVFWGSLTAGRLLAIPIAARLAPRTILLGDLVGCLASVALVLLCPGSTVATWVGTVGAGLTMASIFPTTISLAERHMAVTGRVTGWFGMGASAGGMAVPWLIGQFFESVGPRVTMVSVATDVTVAVAVYAALIVCAQRVANGRAVKEAA